jgi:hypothetical protein
LFFFTFRIVPLKQQAYGQNQCSGNPPAPTLPTESCSHQRQSAKVAGDRPMMWLMSDDFSRLKFRESSEEFGRLVLASLSPELVKKWSHEDADLSESPLGKECSEVSESDRVHLVAEPDSLNKFVIERLDEFMELVPAIDQALQKMTRR